MWRNKQTDFHQSSVNSLLTRFWSGLVPNPIHRIFVPLCGKSLDLVWLANQGHAVVGVELSHVAIAAFFKDNGLIPKKVREGKFTVWSCGRIEIICGDFFQLETADLGEIDAVYDRAALTAFSENVRQQYVSHLRKIVPRECRIFLLTTEDGEPAVTGDQLLEDCDEVDDEVRGLYGDYFIIELAHTEVAYEQHDSDSGNLRTRSEHKVYRLTARNLHHADDLIHT